MNYEAACVRANATNRRYALSTGEYIPPPPFHPRSLDIRPYFVDPGGGRPESI